MNIEEFTEDLREYFQMENNVELQIEQDENIVNVYLDLPNTDNYDTHIDEIENFFRKYNINHKKQEKYCCCFHKNFL